MPSTAPVDGTIILLIIVEVPVRSIVDFQFDCNSGLFFSQVYFSLLTKSMAGGRRHQGPADTLQYATGACESRSGGNNQDNVR